MAINDDRLKQFFSKQKVGAFDALAHKGKVTAEKAALVVVSTDITGTRASVSVAPLVTIHNDRESDTLAETKNQNESLCREKSGDTEINTVKIKHEEQLNKEFLSNELLAIDIQPNQNNEKIHFLDTSFQPLATRYQTVTDPLPTAILTDIKPLANSEHIVSKTLAIPLAKFGETQFTDLRVFSKKESELMTLIFGQCRNNGALISPPISTEEIRNALNITPERVRNLIFRITKKGGIHIVQHKSGQNAYRVFELPLSLYQAMIEKQGNQFANDPLAKPLASIPYSSSSDIKTTTTNLPDEWKSINCIPLKVINFGFTELKNIYRKCPRHIDQLVIQDSINQFAFGLKNNPDRYKNMTAPSGILVKNLCEGNPWVENDYVSPEEKLRIEKESRITKLIEQQFKEPKFIEWFNNLEQTERENMVPDVLKNGVSYKVSKSVYEKEHALRYFENKCWPDILVALASAIVSVT